MVRLTGAARKAVITEITMLYNCGEQEKQLRMHSMLGSGADRPCWGSTSVSQKHKSEGAVEEGSPTEDEWKKMAEGIYSDSRAFDPNLFCKVLAADITQSRGKCQSLCCSWAGSHNDHSLSF